MEFSITKNPEPVSDGRRAELLTGLGFGRVFTDHMTTLKWSAQAGWDNGRITAREPFAIDPAAGVLHYGQVIFEGLKAFRIKDGSVALFRPELHAARFIQSAERLVMPSIPRDLFVEAVEQLVRIDREWIPAGDNSALYLCPFMFASEAFLGVRPASEYVFCVIACPVGSYFGGDKTLRVWVSEKYSRAASGGTGAAKCAGNYAGSLAAQADAKAHGCDQVVFLDAGERRWVEELGAMNIFFVMDDGTLLTPPTDGTILPGVTRATIIELAKSNGMKVHESKYSFERWRADAASGHLREAFACGTAAVVVGIGEVHDTSGSFRIADGVTGEVCKALRRELIDIQRGRHETRREWLRVVT